MISTPEGGDWKDFRQQAYDAYAIMRKRDQGLERSMQMLQVNGVGKETPCCTAVQAMNLVDSIPGITSEGIHKGRVIILRAYGQPEETVDAFARYVTARKEHQMQDEFEKALRQMTPEAAGLSADNIIQGLPGDMFNSMSDSLNGTRGGQLNSSNMMTHMIEIREQQQQFQQQMSQQMTAFTQHQQQAAGGVSKEDLQQILTTFGEQQMTAFIEQHQLLPVLGKEQQQEIAVATKQTQVHHRNVLHRTEQRCVLEHNLHMEAKRLAMEHAETLAREQTKLACDYAEDETYLRGFSNGYTHCRRSTKDEIARVKDNEGHIAPHTIPEEYWPMRCDIEDLLPELTWNNKTLIPDRLPYTVTVDNIEERALQLYDRFYRQPNVPVRVGKEQKLLWFAKDRELMIRAVGMVLNAAAPKPEKQGSVGRVNQNDSAVAVKRPREDSVGPQLARKRVAAEALAAATETTATREAEQQATITELRNKATVHNPYMRESAARASGGSGGGSSGGGNGGGGGNSSSGGSRSTPY